MPEKDIPVDRLEGWKEIAVFFNRTDRAVKRWEAERGLPIHRLPGGPKARVYAYRQELAAWLTQADETPANDEATNTPVSIRARIPARFRNLMSLTALVTAIAGAICGAVWLAPVLRPIHEPPAQARALYLKGIDDWNARTPESLNQALDEFTQAAMIDPDYADAFAGQAKVYVLMREYTAMPSSQGFALAKNAAEHAIRLDDRSADAHAALAFALFYGYNQAAAARREYRKAIHLEPGNPTTQQWYATFLDARGDFAEAVRHIDKAQELSPSSMSIRADRAILLFDAGQEEEAIAILHRMLQTSPSFKSVHDYLAQIAYARHEDTTFVREFLASARLAKNSGEEKVALAAAAGLASGGHEGMLKALLNERMAQLTTGNASPFIIAGLQARLGNKAKATEYFNLAVARRDENAVYYRSDRDVATLKGYAPFDKAYQRLEKAAGF